MALTRRVDGTQTQNLVNAAWWNDFYDLLTGTTTDQPVTIANSLTTTRQGSTSVRTDLLQLKTTTSAAHEYHLYVGTAGEYGIWDVTNNLKVFSATTTGLTFGGAPILSAVQSGASAAGLTFKTWNGTASVTPFSIGGQFNSALSWVDNSGNLTLGGNLSGPIGGSIPTTRNGAALSAPTFTGTTTPVNPPTGSTWIKA